METIVERYPGVHWSAIKECWSTGVGSLADLAKENEIPLSAILLAAKEENWPDRGSPWVNVKLKEPPTTDEVSQNHKKCLGVVNDIVELLLKQLEFEDNLATRAKILDKLSAVMVRNITMERNVHGLTADSDGAPDRVVINMS